MNKRTISYLYLLAVVIIWGAASSVIKFTLQGIEPIPFLVYRFGISSIVSVAYLSFARPKIPKLTTTLPFAVLYGSVAYVVALSALFIGLNSSTVLDLTLIGTITPLVVAIGGAVFFHDRITRREKLGTTIAFAGSLLALVLPILAHNEARLTGNIWLFIFMFADAGAYLIAKEITNRLRMPAEALSNIGLLSAGIVFALIGSVMYGPTELIRTIVALPFPYHLGVWYMAILSGSLAYYFSIRGQQSIEVSEAGLFLYLQPLVSTPLAILWLGEGVTTTFVLGAILIVLGVSLAEYKHRKHPAKHYRRQKK